MLKTAGIAPAAVTDVMVHATTVVTNAVIERKGPLTALLVTEGFRDILPIRDEHRYEMFDPQIEFPEPLISREHDVRRRRAHRCATGEVVKPVDAKQIEALVDAAARQGRGLGRGLAPQRLSQSRERARDARHDSEARAGAVRLDLVRRRAADPRVSAHLDRRDERLHGADHRALSRRAARRAEERGFVHDPLIMLSRTAASSASTSAKRFPVRMVESGPAAGALAASFYAEVLGLDRLLSFDMGGTTAKACIIEDRTPLVVGNFEVDRIYRFKSGSGLPILIPSVDMIEIGAGGGSIASVSDLGLLKVGPQSAGSTPGPVCYGRGGTNRRVTDADLVLGYLDPPTISSAAT